MDNVTKAVLENDSLEETQLSPANHALEEEDDFEGNFFDDEKSRKPKGKKIKRMRFNFDR